MSGSQKNTRSLRDIAEDLANRLEPLAARRVTKQIARSLAAKGRGRDTKIAHVTPGEVVLPAALQTPEVMQAVRAAAARAGISLDRYWVGSPQNSINPGTGAPEFDEAGAQGLLALPFDPDVVASKNLGPDPNDIGAADYPLPEITVPSTTWDRFKTGVADPYYGVAQLVGKIPGAPHVMDQEIVGRENTYQRDRAAAGSDGWDIPRAAGRLAGAFPLLAMAPEGMLPAMAVGAVRSAMNPVPTNSSEDFWSGKAKQAVEGALKGGAFRMGVSASKDALTGR